MEIVKWDDIISECGDYRSGFVAVFKKYEGLPTDEKDAIGRTIKVTSRSFAQHVGIPEATFRAWVKRVVRGAPEPSQAWDRTRISNDAKRATRRAAKNDPEIVVDVLMGLPDKAQDHIFHELKLRRAGEDRSPTHQKRVKATVDEMLKPIDAAIDQAGAGLMPGLMDQANDLGQAVIDSDADISAHEENIKKALARLTETCNVMFIYSKEKA